MCLKKLRKQSDQVLAKKLEIFIFAGLIWQKLHQSRAQDLAVIFLLLIQQQHKLVLQVAQKLLFPINPCLQVFDLASVPLAEVLLLLLP